MIAAKQIEIANAILARGIVKTVYHSVELVANETMIKYPVYKKGAEQFYIGPDDTKDLFCYIRQSGPAVVREEKKEGSDKKLYILQVPTRIVFFKDHEERDFDTLTMKLLDIAFLTDISLVRFSNNSFELASQESPIGRFSFDATTFYMAIDIIVKIKFLKSDCEVDDCIVHPNPICKP